MITNEATDVAQPLGVFDLPAGYFLIEPSEASETTRMMLLAGRRPEEFPAELGFYQLALDGELDAAAAALADDHSPYAMVNRFIMDPSPISLAQLEGCGVPEVTEHAQVMAFVVGLAPQPPDVGDRTGAARALACAAWATYHLERNDRNAATEYLERAAQAANDVSAPMAGQLLGQLANVQLDTGAIKQAVVTFEAALDKLAGTDLATTQAELHVAAGAAFQEMSEAAPRLMQKAIDHYHQAMALVNADSAPETFAIANANLGLAYITMPMNEASDQLRIGVAVQSMREALNYFSPEVLPDRWASTQLNLANALVYMPSTHQAANIAEAVGLYEGVLQHRDRSTDPLGRARVLANQGNALAHLGVFDDATVKLHEARAIFEEFEETQAVQMVRSLLGEIAKQQAHNEAHES